MHEAKTQFSRLVDKALKGEEVIIARHGHGLVRLTPLVKIPAERTPGLSQGLGWVHPDFDDPLPQDILEGFESHT